MTTTAATADGNASAAAPSAATAARSQPHDDDTEARLAGVEALLDESARTLKTLHAAVVLSGGRPPVQAELDLASRARETLAAVARALPPRALLAGPGAGAGGGVGGENSNNNRIDGDKLARLSAVERTVQNMGMLPPVVVVPAPTVAAAAGTAAAGGATAEEVAPQQQQKHARLVVLAGPCGSGKTTVGRALSALMGSAVPFLDADDYHDAAAKSKMSQGEALDEGDRVPWLERVAAAAREAAVFSPSHVAVLACSALKKKYRDLIVEVANEAEVPSVAVDFVLLKATRDSLRTRLERRQEIMQKSSGACEEVAGHFLHPSLLDSQLESWEDSAEVVVVENDGGGNDEGGSGSGGGREDEAAATRRAAEAVLKAVGLEKGKL